MRRTEDRSSAAIGGTEQQGQALWVEGVREAWSERGATTGMIDYYRASVRESPKRAEAALRPISAPTLVIWGQDDRYLSTELAEPDHEDVPELDRVGRLPGASHRVHHDEPERVTRLLMDFFGPALAAQSR